MGSTRRAAKTGRSSMAQITKRLVSAHICRSSLSGAAMQSSQKLPLRLNPHGGHREGRLCGTFLPFVEVTGCEGETCVAQSPDESGMQRSALVRTLGSRRGIEAAP